MTLRSRLRRRVRHAVGAARAQAAKGAGGVRVVDTANVVVARNIGAQGEAEASAHQSVVVRNGSIHERTQRTAHHTDADPKQ